MLVVDVSTENYCTICMLGADMLHFSSEIQTSNIVVYIHVYCTLTGDLAGLGEILNNTQRHKLVMAPGE